MKFTLLYISFTYSFVYVCVTPLLPISFVDEKFPGFYSNCIDVMLECLDEGLSTTLGSLGNCVLAIKRYVWHIASYSSKANH